MLEGVLGSFLNESLNPQDGMPVTSRGEERSAERAEAGAPVALVEEEAPVQELGIEELWLICGLNCLDPYARFLSFPIEEKEKKKDHNSRKNGSSKAVSELNKATGSNEDQQNPTK